MIEKQAEEANRPIKTLSPQSLKRVEAVNAFLRARGLSGDLNLEEAINFIHNSYTDPERVIRIINDKYPVGSVTGVKRAELYKRINFKTARLDVVLKRAEQQQVIEESAQHVSVETVKLTSGKRKPNWGNDFFRIKDALEELSNEGKTRRAEVFKILEPQKPVEGSFNRLASFISQFEVDAGIIHFPDDLKKNINKGVQPQEETGKPATEPESKPSVPSVKYKVTIHGREIRFNTEIEAQIAKALPSDPKGKQSREHSLTLAGLFYKVYGEDSPKGKKLKKEDREKITALKSALEGGLKELEEAGFQLVKFKSHEEFWYTLKLPQEILDSNKENKKKDVTPRPKDTANRKSELEGFFQDPRIKGIIKEFLDSDAANNLREVIKGTYTSFKEFEDNNCLPNISGYIFERLAYFYLRSRLNTVNPNIILLDIDQTTNLYLSRLRQLGRSFKIDYSNILAINPMIPGVSIPDGLIFVPNGEGDWEMGVCEYKLSRNFTGFTSQIERYRTGGELKDSLGVDSKESGIELGRLVSDMLKGSFIEPKPVIIPDERMLLFVPVRDYSMTQTSIDGISSYPMSVSYTQFLVFSREFIRDVLSAGEVGEGRGGNSSYSIGRLDTNPIVEDNAPYGI